MLQQEMKCVKCSEHEAGDSAPSSAEFKTRMSGKKKSVYIIYIT
jgi:hypothetical protein